MASYVVSPSIDDMYKSDEAKIQRPSTLQDPILKHEMQYCVEVPRWMFAAHLRNESGIPFSQHDRFERNRLYSRNAQGVKRYQDKFYSDIALIKPNTTEYDDGGGEEKERVGYNNINWITTDVFSKIRDYYHSTYDNTEFDILCSAIDQKSGAEREQKELFFSIMKQYGTQLEQIAQIGNLPDIKQEFIPQLDETKMETNAQGFKLIHEEICEMLINYTADSSDYLEIIKPKHIDDHLDYGHIAARQVFNTSTNKLEWEYVNPDPLFSGIQQSNVKDFKDAEWGFTVCWEKVTNLVGKIRPDNPAEEYDIIKQNVQKYCGLYGNYLDWNYYIGENSWYSNLGDFRVPVLHAYWLDYDTERKLIFLALNGMPLRTIDLEWDEKKTAKDIKKLTGKKEAKGNILETNKKRLYKSSWIIGTDIAYDYGLENNQTYPPRLPFVYLKTADVPVAERCIFDIDQINLASFKAQNALIQMRMDGFSINQDMLAEQQIGGKTLTPLEQVEMFIQTGRLVHSHKELLGDNAGNIDLFKTLPGGLGKAFDDIQKVLSIAYNHIQLETGIPLQALGVAPEARQPGKATEAAMQASLNITRPCITHIMWLKNNLAEITANSFTPLFKLDKKAIEAYYPIIGSEGVEVMRISSNYANYGIKMMPRPDNDSWQDLWSLIQLSVQNKEISGDGAARLYQMKQNNYTYKQINAAYQHEVSKTRQMMSQMSQQNQQNQMQLIQANAQTKDQLADKDAQRQMAIDKNIMAGKKEVEDKRADNKAHLKLLDTINT